MDNPDGSKGNENLKACFTAPALALIEAEERADEIGGVMARGNLVLV
jgi:hypothetical protein